MSMIVSLVTFFTIYIVAFAILLYCIFGGFFYGAMWMKLPKKRVERMLELGKVTKETLVYDLGAGFGNIAFQANQRGARVVAVEADWFKAWWIKHQISSKKLRNIFCIHNNLLNVNLSNADILLCYLSDSLMIKIAQKSLKDNVVIVSAAHRINGRQPKIIDRESVTHIYVY